MDVYLLLAKNSQSSSHDDPGIRHEYGSRLYTERPKQRTRLPINFLLQIGKSSGINRTVYSPNEDSGSDKSLRDGTFCMEPRDRGPPAGTQESSGRSCLMTDMALSASTFCNTEYRFHKCVSRPIKGRRRTFEIKSSYNNTNRE